MCFRNEDDYFGPDQLAISLGVSNLENTGVIHVTEIAACRTLLNEIITAKMVIR